MRHPSVGPVLRALFLLALFAPVAAAAQQPDAHAWSASFGEPPELGRTVTLTVAREPGEPIDAALALDVPAWIEVEEPREWRLQAAQGERAERSWRVRATEPGFWRASLAAESPDGGWEVVAGCCLLAWSSDGRALFGARPEQAVPGESTVGYHPSFRALNATHAELTLRSSPPDRRYASEELVVEIPPGAKPQTAPADAWRNFTHTFALAPAASVSLAAGAWVRIGFEGGELAREDVSWSQPIACATFHLAREGDVVHETSRSGCQAEPPATRAIPAAPWLLALALTLACSGRSASAPGTRH